MSKKERTTRHQSTKVLEYLYIVLFSLALLVKIVVIKHHGIWPIVTIYGIVLLGMKKGKKSAKIVFFLLSLISVLVLVFCGMSLYLIVADAYFARQYSGYGLAYIGYVLLGICHIVTCMIMVKRKENE